MRCKRLGVAVVVAMAGACATHTANRQNDGKELTAEIAEIMATNHVYETAVPLLQQGISEDPNNARLHRLLGAVLRDRGIYVEALKELQLANSLQPNDADTAAAMGVLYDLRGNPAAAEIWHRRALDLAPERAEFFNNLGFSMYLQGRNYEAVTAFQEALRRNPNQPRAYNNLGFTLARLKDFDAALRAFQQAGTKAAALANLGLAYELAADLDEARRCYKGALRLDRRLDVARKNLANLARNDHPAAESAPDSPEVMP
ncbi:MAG TPA: tetratricopeptide repeat protein [Myxococcota bacterium]|nr:tetratricopeptide repeat protein [Myxococcota bacterium]